MHEIDAILKLQLDGKHAEARVLSDKLELIGPDKILDPAGKNTRDIWMRHCFNRGWFKIQDGDYKGGCSLLENGRFLNVYGSPPLRTDAPIFNPAEHSLVGKSIIISLEGGMGDEIIHARFATSYKKLGANKVYIASSPELVSVFERIEGVDKVILRDQASTVEHDYWMPGFSAGWIAGHTFDNFPSQQYLSPKQDIVDKWKSTIVSSKIKVGIRWAGNPEFEHQQFRLFPEKFITNLSSYDELEIYSLQRDNNLVELPDSIIDLQAGLTSWEETMGAIANLDLVITSCTSIAHMSAAMGKETWVMVPILPYHTWTYGCPDNNSSPYYDCVKLFRQTERSKWNSTFQEMYNSLETKFNLTHVNHPNEDATTQVTSKIDSVQLGDCRYDFTVAFTPKTTQGNISHIINTFGIPNTIIEVGCYEGGTTFWMAESIGKLNNNLTIYGIDPHDTSVDILEDLEKAHERFVHNMSRCPVDVVKYIRKKSSEGLIDLINKGVKAEFIYIDGDHTAGAVLSDLVLAWELLKPGGVILCDDATEWQFKNHKNGEVSAQMSPRMAIEMFIQCNWHRLKPVWVPDGLQTAFVKIC